MDQKVGCSNLPRRAIKYRGLQILLSVSPFRLYGDWQKIGQWWMKQRTLFREKSEIGQLSGLFQAQTWNLLLQ